MSKSKNRKGHKEKVLARKNRLDQQKNKIEKMKREFINEVIKAEKEKGLFDNVVNTDSASGPII